MTDRADIYDGLAIPATQISAEARRRAAASFVKHAIVPTIAAAFETYPELDSLRSWASACRRSLTSWRAKCATLASS